MSRGPLSYTIFIPMAKHESESTYISMDNTRLSEKTFTVPLRFGGYLLTIDRGVIVSWHRIIWPYTMTPFAKWLLPNRALECRLLVELHRIKRQQSPYPLGFNDHIYQQGNISSMRSNILFNTRSSQKCLFLFQLLGECHCWWTKESTRAYVAKFYSRLRFICSVWRASTFSVFEIDWNCNSEGLFHRPFWL